MCVYIHAHVVHNKYTLSTYCKSHLADLITGRTCLATVEHLALCQICTQTHDDHDFKCVIITKKMIMITSACMIIWLRPQMMILMIWWSIVGGNLEQLSKCRTEHLKHESLIKAALKKSPKIIGQKYLLVMINDDESDLMDDHCC